MDQMIASAVSGMSDNKRKVVQDFLGDLLSGNYDSDTIQAAWNGNPTDLFIEDHEQLISFLSLIQKQT
jgi:hypothetical protein